MTIELVMQITRGEDDRLSGNVRDPRNAGARDFSGTLELMRALEDLVPGERSDRRSTPPEVRS